MDLKNESDGMVVNRRGFVAGAALAGSVLALPDALLAAPSSALGDEPFDTGWRFHRGDLTGAEAAAFDDRGWRALDLPHDWSVEAAPGRPTDTGGWDAPAALWSETPRPPLKPGEIIALPQAPKPLPDGAPRRVGPFDADDSPSQWGAGWTLGGTGWYRKRFEVPALGAGERLEIRFDGAFQTTEVWLNGARAGGHDHGHSGFAIDLTPHLRAGANVLAVRVRNEGFTSRWYNGSGIYRHVWLRRTHDVQVPLWGVFVSTPAVSTAGTDVRIAVEVRNAGAAAAQVAVAAELRDPNGSGAGSATASVRVDAGATLTTVLTMRLATARLWSVDSPSLYTAQITLAAGGLRTDRVEVPFGIRTIAADARNGFTINGEVLKLKGACLHHDHGFLGVASYDHAEERKVALLKANGYNAIRCSHNLYAPAFYDACDRLGMIVIDETFDVWKEGKLGQDLGASRFEATWRESLSNMIRRDRNHPSIAFWSIGNEIPERNKPEGVKIAAALREAVLAMDTSRLITAAAPPPETGKDAEPGRRYLDVAGLNYLAGADEVNHVSDPDKVFMGTEQFAKDIHDAWVKVERYPWMIGDFVWTGIDYLGEVGAGSSQLRRDGEKPPASALGFGIFLWDYPAYQSGCGEIDLIGLKKPQGWYRDVLWQRSPLELLVQRPTPAGFHEELGSWAFPDELKSWTWPDGGEMTVRAYTRGDEVRLLLNGREVARRRVGEGDRLTAEMKVPYRPGTLTAIAMRDGAEIGRQMLETVGPAARVKLRAERVRAPAGRGEIAYVYAEIKDARDRLVPDAQHRIRFVVEGAAELIASGSANPRGIESFTDPSCTTFHGTAQAIVRSSGRRGVARLSVFSPGLVSDTASVSCA